MDTVIQQRAHSERKEFLDSGHIFVYPFIESMTFTFLVKGWKGC